MVLIIVALVVLQLLSFYFIILLNMKLSKFKDLERKQEQLMREMDDAVGVYLLEMREENNRLIEELSKQPVQNHFKKESIGDFEKQDDISINREIEQQTGLLQQEAAALELETRTFVPKTVVANAYKQQKVQTTPSNAVQSSVIQQEVESPEDNSLTYEEEVLKLFEAGQTAEQIAKKMHKGKTEIELLLKFHQ